MTIFRSHLVGNDYIILKWNRTRINEKFKKLPDLKELLETKSTTMNLVD
jgi:hypothetical protein